MAHIDTFKEAIESFASVQLDAYLGHLSTGRIKTTKIAKEFNDPICRTIKLHPQEQVVLDSPLLQRLGFIRHLGVVHLVYRSALHTRLEHSLGVVHLLQSLVNSINSAETYVGEQYTRLLRMAALCHDVGHGTMSHVSETAVDNFPDTEIVKLEFADREQTEVVSLHEIATYYILGSPAFLRLLSIAREITGDEKLPPDLVPNIQKIIIKKPICEEIPLLQELISGPFDADKLDYMVRDPMMCGVPVIADIPRLIQKVRGARVSVVDLPQRIARAVGGERNSYIMTGVALSGNRTLDELLVGRHFLFDKIYRHQKVRSAEAMVAAIFHQIGELITRHAPFCIYRLDDDELFRLSPEKVASLAGRKLSSEEQQKCEIAAHLAERLRNRELLVRSFAFSANMPRDPYASDPTQFHGLIRLRTASENPAKRGPVVQNICAEAERMMALIGETGRMSRLPGGKLEPYVWISPPQAPRKYGDIMQANLITDDGKVLPYRVESSEARGWADAYLINADIGYVFAPFEVAPFVYLAAECVARRDFGIRIPDSMMAFAKQSRDVLDGLREKLAAAGYYKSLPYDIRPMPKALRSAETVQVVRNCLTNLRGYEGIADTDSRRKAAFDPQRVVDWARQFDDPDLVQAALTTAASVQLIGRANFVTGIRRFIQDEPDFRDALVCSLGSAKDSGVIAAYYASDVVSEFNIECVSLSEALRRDSRPIMFVDDFIGSGKQASTIVQAQMGAELTYALGEDRETLPEALRVALRARKLAYFFSVASDDGAARFRKHLSEMGVQASVGFGRATNELPHAFDADLFGGAKKEEKFRKRCEEVGRQLLVDRTHDDAWASDKLLGYGNRAYLVVFPYNTPAQTLTCLWKEGVVDGTPWIPLFPRRKKQ